MSYEKLSNAHGAILKPIVREHGLEDFLQVWCYDTVAAISNLFLIDDRYEGARTSILRDILSDGAIDVRQFHWAIRQWITISIENVLPVNQGAIRRLWFSLKYVYEYTSTESQELCNAIADRSEEHKEFIGRLAGQLNIDKDIAKNVKAMLLVCCLRAKQEHREHLRQEFQTLLNNWLSDIHPYADELFFAVYRANGLWLPGTEDYLRLCVSQIKSMPHTTRGDRVKQIEQLKQIQARYLDPDHMNPSFEALREAQNWVTSQITD